MTLFDTSLECAKQLDAQDVLAEFRQQFFIPQHNHHDVAYFTGNSLGLQPKQTIEYLQQELSDWANFGVEGHFKAQRPWLSYHENFPELLSPIVGAHPHELVVMNQLTVNLHLLLVSFYKPTKQRYKIICEAKAFPSDQYALESQVNFHGFNYADAVVEVHPRPGEHTIHPADILSTIEQHKNEVALVMFGGVNYYTGQVFDMASITQKAHEVGALCGFDLAHAAGNIALHLHNWQVDFACWCSYKYLNSGPGGVSGVFIHEKHHQNQTIPRFAGWWGYQKNTRFNMEKGFVPIPTAEAWQLSNAPVLSMAAHLASLHIFKQAGFDRLQQKKQLLTRYTWFLLEKLNQEKQLFTIITPTAESEHGCQISLLTQHNGKQLFNALTAAGIITDWREPNVIRLAPVPLYNSFEDVWKLYHTLQVF